MNEEKDFFKTCFNTVAGLEVKNESQAIAKEVVLSEIENLEQENKQLKTQIEEYQKALDETMSEKMDIENNWNKLKEYIGAEWYCFDNESVEFEIAKNILNKMQELEQGNDNDK